MEQLTESTKFKCLITNAMEEYDSGIWEFFRHYDSILADLGQLMHLDSEWRDNYVKLIRYCSDLQSSIILKRKAPDSEFLSPLISKEIGNTDVEDVLFRSKDSVPGFLIKIEAELERLIAEFLRLSKMTRFSESFDVEKLGGIKLFAKVIYSRGIEKSKQ